MKAYKPLHPGLIVREILMEGANLTVTAIAKKLDVHRTTVSRLLNGNAGISADMALRLSKLLPNTDIQFWMNLQRDYDIWTVQRYDSKIQIKPLDQAA
jgi:addiction module HigA family antidote